MTIVRANLQPTERLHVDMLAKYLADKNPEAKINFYGEDFIRFGNMYSCNWIGLFAVACHLTNYNPFFVATETHTPKYVVKGGTLSRYLALSRDLSAQYKFGEHWNERSFTLGEYTIEGQIIENIIQDIIEFSELPDDVRKQFPPDGVIKLPEPVAPADEVKLEEKRTPFWWKLVKRPVQYALVGVVGALFGQIPAIKEYADEIIFVLIAVIEYLLF